MQILRFMCIALAANRFLGIHDYDVTVDKLQLTPKRINVIENYTYQCPVCRKIHNLGLLMRISNENVKDYEAFEVKDGFFEWYFGSEKWREMIKKLFKK